MELDAYPRKNMQRITLALTIVAMLHSVSNPWVLQPSPPAIRAVLYAIILFFIITIILDYITRLPTPPPGPGADLFLARQVFYDTGRGHVGFYYAICALIWLLLHELGRAPPYITNAFTLLSLSCFWLRFYIERGNDDVQPVVGKKIVYVDPSEDFKRWSETCVFRPGQTASTFAAGAGASEQKLVILYLWWFTMVFVLVVLVISPW